jgi:hypothetical protein
MRPVLAGDDPADGWILCQGRAQRVPARYPARIVGGIHDVAGCEAQPLASRLERLPSPDRHRLARKFTDPSAARGVGGTPWNRTGSGSGHGSVDPRDKVGGQASRFGRGDALAQFLTVFDAEYECVDRQGQGVTMRHHRRIFAQLSAE